MTTRRELAGVWLAGAVTVGTVLVVGQGTADSGDDFRPPRATGNRPGTPWWYAVFLVTSAAYLTTVDRVARVDSA